MPALSGCGTKISVLLKLNSSSWACLSCTSVPHSDSGDLCSCWNLPPSLAHVRSYEVSPNACPFPVPRVQECASTEGRGAQMVFATFGSGKWTCAFVDRSSSDQLLSLFRTSRTSSVKSVSESSQPDSFLLSGCFTSPCFENQADPPGLLCPL